MRSLLTSPLGWDNAPALCIIRKSYCRGLGASEIPSESPCQGLQKSQAIATNIFHIGRASHLQQIARATGVPASQVWVLHRPICALVSLGHACHATATIQRCGKQQRGFCTCFLLLAKFLFSEPNQTQWSTEEFDPFICTKPASGRGAVLGSFL